MTRDPTTPRSGGDDLAERRCVECGLPAWAGPTVVFEGRPVCDSWERACPTCGLPLADGCRNAEYFRHGQAEAARAVMELEPCDDEDDDLRPGERVEHVRTSDPYTHLCPGDPGTVTVVDHLRTAHVGWDSGSTLGMPRGQDVLGRVGAEGCNRCGRVGEGLDLCTRCAAEELARGLKDLANLIRRAQAEG